MTAVVGSSAPAAPAPSGAKNLIEVHNLHVVYKTRGDDVHAVKGMTFDVGVGHSTGIVGESGSGKSTVAKAIVGLIAPAQGSIRIDSDLVAGAQATGYVRANRWKVQMIFQDPYGSLDPRQQPLDAVAEAVHQWRSQSKSASKAGRRSTSCARSTSLSVKPPRGCAHSQAVSASGCRSPERSPRDHRCWLPTSRPRRWTSRHRPRS